MTRLTRTIAAACGAVLLSIPAFADEDSDIDAKVKAALANLDGHARTIMEQTGLPGLAVAVVHNGEVVFAEGYGVKEVGKDSPITPSTVFQIASLSKSLAATVVARQVGEGVVSWDDPVKTHLPWFTLSDPWVTDHVTIGDLFAHRSGLPDHAGDDLEDFGFGRKAILERLSAFPLNPLRITYAYTNYGLTAAGEAVAVASGKTWADLSENVLYAPLGMDDTSSRFADFIAKEDRAIGHTRVDGTFVPYRSRQPDPQSPAGGVSSTVLDFSRWMRMVLDGGMVDGTELVKEEALNSALTVQVVSNRRDSAAVPPSFYGFGVGVSVEDSGRMMLSHSGAFTLGAGTNYRMLPALNLGIVAFSNGAPVGAVEALTMTFTDEVQYGAPRRDWLSLFQGGFAQMLAPIGELVGQTPPSDAAPAAALSAYEGTYQNAYFGPLKVTAEDDGLALTIGPAGMTFPLTHWSANTFTASIINESLVDGSLSQVIFTPSNDGTMESMTVEVLNEEGFGTFARTP
ncbi:MAG: serine hydrolase [Pseudomonadota bacterium]